MKCFVANRTSEILTNTKRSQWKHIKSSENPADLASRGLLVNNFASNSLWWYGPSWLKYSEDLWSLNEIKYDETSEEIKPNVTRAMNAALLRDDIVSVEAERC